MFYLGKLWESGSPYGCLEMVVYCYDKFVRAALGLDPPHCKNHSLLTMGPINVLFPYKVDLVVV